MLSLRWSQTFSDFFLLDVLNPERSAIPAAFVKSRRKSRIRPEGASLHFLLPSVVYFYAISTSCRRLAAFLTDLAYPFLFPLFSLENLRPAYLLEYPSGIGKTARLFKILQDRPMIFTFPFIVFKSFVRFTWPAEACCCQNSQQKWLMRLHENRQRVRRVRDVTFGSV